MSILFQEDNSQIGLVASRARALTAGGFGFANVMGRSAHFATENLTSIKLAYGNWLIGNGDNGSGGTQTWTASIEYPSGTFTQVTFNGGFPSMVVADGATVTSDFITVSIPSGAQFWVRMYLSNCTTIQMNHWCNTFLGEATDFGVGTDMTMGGTISGTSWSLPPLAILGVTNNPSVIIVGDSIAAGYADTEDSSSSATGYNGKIGVIARGLGDVPFLNLAVHGQTAQGFATNSNYKKFAMGFGSILVNEFGNNDLTSGTRANALVQADVETINNYARSLNRSMLVYQTTVTPRSTSTDSWATVANQTTVSTLEIYRPAFNDNVRAGIYPNAGYVDITLPLESSFLSGKWIATPSPPYTGDGIHPNLAGNVLIGNSGVVADALGITVSAPTGPQTLSPSLYTDPDTFYAATVVSGQTLAPSLYTDADTFYAATVTRGTVTLTPGLYTDADTFYSATISLGGNTLAPSLYTDADTFYAATVTAGAVTLTPGLYTDPDTFYGPVVSLGSGQTLVPSLYTDADTFFAATVTRGTVTLTPARYDDADTFFAATVTPGGITLSPPLYTDADTFFAPTVTKSNTVAPPLYTDADTFFTPTVTRGAVSLLPSLYIDSDIFFPPTIQAAFPQTLTATRYDDPDFFYAPFMGQVEIAFGKRGIRFEYYNVDPSENVDFTSVEETYAWFGTEANKIDDMNVGLADIATRKSVAGLVYDSHTLTSRPYNGLIRRFYIQVTYRVSPPRIVPVNPRNLNNGGRRRRP